MRDLPAPLRLVFQNETFWAIFKHCETQVIIPAKVFLLLKLREREANLQSNYRCDAMRTSSKNQTKSQRL